MSSYSVENVSNKSKRASRIYKDLDLDFGRNTTTNDVNKLTDVEAVKRSVRNLINTSHYERPFHPEIGSSVRGLLFEPITPLTSLNLQRKVEEVLTNFEPRIRLVQVLSRPNADLNRYSLSSSVIGSTSIFARLAFAMFCMSGALSIKVPSRSKMIRAFIFVVSLS